MISTLKKISSPRALKEQIPIDPKLAAARLDAISQIEAILRGEDGRKLFIVGPCSADDPNAAIDYAVRLSRVAEKIKDRIFVVLRMFTAKPRTRGEGYMGLLHTPGAPSGEVNIAEGIAAMRRLHVRVASESGLFTADELLYPEAVRYVDDIVCYFSVGTRSSDDQLHRFVASGLDVPVGIKNPLNGNLDSLAASVRTARNGNEFLFCGEHVRTFGNDRAHPVLRGSVSANGEHIPNYGYESVMKISSLCGGRVIVDVGHSNSGKNENKQCEVLRDMWEIAKQKQEYGSAVAGVMIESYIAGGSGAAGSMYGRSLTDGCLSFEDTERLLLRASDGMPS